MQVGHVSDEEKRQEIARSLGFLTASELAILAGVKVETLEAWRKRRQGPSYVHFGNEPLYPLAGIRKFLEDMCCEQVKKSNPIGKSRRHIMDAL